MVLTNLFSKTETVVNNFLNYMVINLRAKDGSTPFIKIREQFSSSTSKLVKIHLRIDHGMNIYNIAQH